MEIKVKLTTELAEMTKLFASLARQNNFAGLSKTEFAKRAAHFLAELNAIHPFREGNGRTQREFVQLLARRSGYLLRWKLANKEELLQASIESFRGNLLPLSDILWSITQRLGS